MNAKHTKKLYLGTDGGVYLSLDRGATWLFLQNLPVGQFYHVAVDNVTPYRIYGGLQDNGTWMAPSSAPGGLSNSHWQSIYWGDGFWAQPDPADPDRKSTRLNSSHQIISYAVFCLKKKKINMRASHMIVSDDVVKYPGTTSVFETCYNTCATVTNTCPMTAAGSSPTAAATTATLPC